MNKKLVALAVAGVLGAPLAQAQTANVTLYGRVNLDIEFVNGKIYNNNVKQPDLCNKTLNTGNCITTNPAVYRMGSNSSRFGLRGTESLGGGLNAIFQLESSIDPAHSGGTLAGRESFVGLQGGWGTVKIGRFLMPYDDLVAASVRYDSPNLSGFTFSAQYGEQGGSYANPGVPITTPAVNNAKVFGAAAFYNNGPIQLGVGYEGNFGVRGRQATNFITPTP